MQQVKILHMANTRFAITVRDAEVHVDRSQADRSSGAAFRSGELVLGGLGTCTLDSVVTFARNTGLPIEGVTADVVAEEVTNPRRLDRIRVNINLPEDVPQRRLASLQRVAHSCKIHHTLTSSAQVEMHVLPPGQQ